MLYTKHQQVVQAQQVFIKITLTLYTHLCQYSDVAGSYSQGTNAGIFSFMPFSGNADGATARVVLVP